MTDEKAVFLMEVRERGALVKQSRGSTPHPKTPRTKKVSRQEWMKMNGPTVSYNINAPMPYENFKALPKEAQQYYIQALIDKWQVGPHSICHMLGLNPKTGAGTRLFQRLGIKVKQAATKEAQDRFAEEFLGQKAQVVAAAPKKQIAKPTSATEAPQMFASGLSMNAVTFDLAGKYAPEAVAHVLERLIATGTRVRLHIELEVLSE